MHELYVLTSNKKFYEGVKEIKSFDFIQNVKRLQQ